MAMAYVVMPAYDDINSDEMLDRAREAGNRALAIDSGNVLALTALAYTDALQYRNASAEKLFGRAIEIDSSFATAHFWRALLFLQQQRNDEALADILKARSLEPASLVINTGVTQVLYDMRRYDEAERSGRGVLALDSTFQLGIIDLAKVLIEKGKANEAIAMLSPIIDLPGLSHLEKAGAMAYALARAGRQRQSHDARRGRHTAEWSLPRSTQQASGKGRSKFFAQPSMITISGSRTTSPLLHTMHCGRIGACAIFSPAFRRDRLGLPWVSQAMGCAME
jgi:tetratricopeptide (TPR) repeat protein